MSATRKTKRDDALDRRGSDWHKCLLTPLLRFGEGTSLSAVHAEYLDDYHDHLVKTGWVRILKKGGRRPKRKGKYSPSTLRRQLGFAQRVFAWGHTRG